MERGHDLGVRRLRRRGGLTEFESLREYVRGDDVRLVDWKGFARHGKPLVRVHEADPDKGGGTLADLRAECPEELRAAIFDAGWPIAVWHRIEAFQHVSLKVIAEALLLKTLLKKR